ncbi:MAG: O-antigen ligase family protein [Thermomicrobiales bacterium]|nr:O-antigen ligase family protein [Thermomicrobiales bacterium]
MSVGLIFAAICGAISSPLPLAVIFGMMVALAGFVAFIVEPKLGILFLVSLFGLGTYSNFGGTVSIYGIASIGVAAAWLMHSSMQQSLRIPNSTTAIFAVAFLLMCAVSLSWASDVRRGITWLIPLGQGTLLSLMIGSLTRTRRDFQILVGTFVISTGFGVAWGAFQEYVFRTSGWEAYYETNTRGTGALTIGDSARISGTFFNPASLATYSLLALIFSMFFLSSLRRPRWLPLWLGLAGLFAWGVLATLSRGPIIVMMLLLPVFAWLFRKRIKFVIAFALLLAPLLARFAPTDLMSRLSTVTDFGSRNVSNGERLFIVRAGIDLISDFPLIGVGYANFPVRIAPYMGIEQYRYSARDAHNVVIEVLGEIGLIGMVIFATMLLSAISSLARTMRNPFPREYAFVPRLAMLSMVALCSMVLVGLTTPIRADRYLYFILGLAMAMEALRQRGPQTVEDKPAPWTNPMWPPLEPARPAR